MTEDTFVAVILDDSGSMYGQRTGAEEAYNATVDPLRKEDYFFSSWMFSDRIEHVEDLIESKDAKKLVNFNPNGLSTKLYDALDKAINDLDQYVGVFLVIVITDGHDNASRIGSKALGDRIKKLQATDKWSFVIACPRNSKSLIVNNLGIPEGNVQEWSDIRQVGAANNVGVQNFRTARSRGATKVENFYCNIGRKDPDEVAGALTKAKQGRYRKLKTTRACAIKEFIEEKGLDFVKGCAYYKLQKKEKIQDYKKVVLIRKDTGEMFDGPAARAVCGLPTAGTGNVSPGNLGEWDVYVQSTSVNRKLLAKMDVIYDKQVPVNV